MTRTKKHPAAQLAQVTPFFLWDWLKSMPKPGQFRTLSGRERAFATGLSFLAALFIIGSILMYPEPILQRSVGFSFLFALIFMRHTTPGGRSLNRIPLVDYFHILGSFMTSGYILVHLERITTRQAFVDSLTTLDVGFGLLTIYLVQEGSRRILGPWIPGINIALFLYLAFGSQLPGRFRQLGFSLQKVVDNLFLTTNGIWSSLIGTALTQIAVFLMFSVIMVRIGATVFLFDAVAYWTRNSWDGFAKVAVITSALFGMISGSSISNVTTTGAITIPAMKKNGYSAEMAAAIESSASVGGIFTPPIMGSVAFIMADTLGVPYLQIAQSAIIPSVLYFLVLFLFIDATAKKRSLLSVGAGANAALTRDTVRKPDRMILNGLIFMLPPAFLIFRLIGGISPARAGLESVAVAGLISLFRGRSLETLVHLWHALVEGIHKSLIIVAVMSGSGIMIGIIFQTGLATQFSSLIMSFAAQSEILALVFVMLLTIFLGFPLNISSAYLIAAVITAPVLVRMGFPALSTHFFIMFFSATATITPPVAVTSLSAASIADANPTRVGFLAMKFSFISYILPYLIMVSPALLWVGQPREIIQAVVFAIAGSYTIVMGLSGVWLTVLIKPIEQVLLVATGFAIITGNLTVALPAGAVLMIVTIKIAISKSALIQK